MLNLSSPDGNIKKQAQTVKSNFVKLQEGSTNFTTKQIFDLKKRVSNQ